MTPVDFSCYNSDFRNTYKLSKKFMVGFPLTIAIISIFYRTITKLNFSLIPLELNKNTIFMKAFIPRTTGIFT